MCKKVGKLAVAMGIPGCGKSSVMNHLADIYNSTVFHEPEEEEWPDAVKNRVKCGHFTSITWFRSIRVPQLFEAYELTDSEQIVFIDSYYDKLLYKYMHKPGIEWLITKDDIYFSVVEEIAKLDYSNLPNADIIIFFKLSKELWKEFLKMRNRDLDKNEDFINQCYAIQDSMIEACEQYAKEFNKKVIFVEQEKSSPDKIAIKVKKMLQAVL